MSKPISKPISKSRWLSPLLFLAIASACTDGGGEADKPEPQADSQTPPDSEEPPLEQPPLEQPSAETKVSVASVQMIQDCPDPAPADDDVAPAAAELARPARPAKPPPGAAARAQPKQAGDEGPGGGRSFRQPCSQSAVQLALEHEGEDPVGFEVKAVRLLSEGKAVGELKTRKPMIWTNNSYQPWDQAVAPGSPAKVSYKLSMPSWSKVEEAIGGSSFKHMFTLELDVVIDGELRTVSSPEFPREQPHVIVT
ncbi:MAG: hypothetical protein R6X02_19560 [Enhygromyxa sp.]